MRLSGGLITYDDAYFPKIVVVVDSAMRSLKETYCDTRRPIADFVIL